MFNLVKMDIRHLFRSRGFYSILLVTTALILGVSALVATMTDQEVLDAMEAQGAEIDKSDYEMKAELVRMGQLNFVHECLGSGFLLVMAGIGMTLFTGGDFSSGYVKNICFVRPRRRDYVLSKLLLAGVYSGVLTVLSILMALLGPILAGLRLAASPLPQLLWYAALLWLPCWAFSLMALALVLLTRTTTLGIIMSLVSGARLTAVLVGTLGGQLGLPPVERYFLSSVVQDLCSPQAGAAAVILACAAGWSVLYAAVSLVAIKNQDI